ncbi:MAG: DUF1540 domain-containing protein [Limnochordia bacterium]|jgi:hypothetical protein
MVLTQVFCTVENCRWWTNNNICEAPKILITSDYVGDRYPENVDVHQVAMLVHETGTTPTDTCMETCCKTFYNDANFR